jgi:hypothetical protein
MPTYCEADIFGELHQLCGVWSRMVDELVVKVKEAKQTEKFSKKVIRKWSLCQPWASSSP